MTGHLEEHEITSAVAGLEVESAARDHLESCVACRRRVADTEELIAARRDDVGARGPDPQSMRDRVLRRLPVEDRAVVHGVRRRWLRPALAAAAVLVVAVGLGLLQLPGGNGTPSREEIPIEEILAEADALLEYDVEYDSIPGFESIDPFLKVSDSSSESYPTPGHSNGWS